MFTDQSFQLAEELGLNGQLSCTLKPKQRSSCTEELKYPTLIINTVMIIMTDHFTSRWISDLFYVYQSLQEFVFFQKQELIQVYHYNICERLHFLLSKLLHKKN